MMHTALSPQRCLRCRMSKFRHMTVMERVDPPSDISPSDAVTGSTIAWPRIDLPRSQAYHLSKLSKPIVSTTWQAQRSPCGGMTWLHSSAGTVLSLPASDDDGCCWNTGEMTP